MGSKMLEHAGFHSTSDVAFDILASVTSKYPLNVGCTIRYLKFFFACSLNRASPAYRTSSVISRTTLSAMARALGDLKKKLVGAYREVATTRFGHGKHYTSPLKARHSAWKQAAIAPLGRDARAAHLREKLDSLLGRSGSRTHAESSEASTSNVQLPPSEDAQMEEWVDIDDSGTFEATPDPIQVRIPAPQPTGSAPQRRHDSWEALLPRLEAPFAQYRQAHYGQPPSIIPSSLQYSCTVLTPCGDILRSRMQCLYISSSPTQPWTGISIDLLKVYRAFFERSCDAISAIASALKTVYRRRGFNVLSSRNPGERATDPFRTGLTEAVQWYSNLRERLQARVEAALTATEDILFPPAPPMTTTASMTTTTTSAGADPLPTPPGGARMHAQAGAMSTTASQMATTSTTTVTTSAGADPLPTPPGGATNVVNAASTTNVPSPTPPGCAANVADTANIPPPLMPGRSAHVLRERCPACFALEEWGRPLEEGGDVQLGADGCFSYCHLQSAGDRPIGYDPAYFISHEKVDKVRAWIAAVRGRNEGEPDACEKSWAAANEKKHKADPKRYDASSIFLLSCRHGQPLFLCNINTPGEQQEYIIALMEEVNSLLPAQVTVLQAYDVGCVTDCTLNLYPIFSEGFRARVSFIINAMHAFGHLWACQLFYNLRFRKGVGITDHEGIERLWSRIRKLIPLTRNQWNSRRIWMIDQYASFVADEGRDTLGTWLQRQQSKNVAVKRNAALKVLRDCCVPEAELRAQWEAQKAAQNAPARLRRELDKVLALQAQINAVEKSISDAKQAITEPGASTASHNALDLLRRLEATHAKLGIQAEALYTSLNIQQDFPGLNSLSLQYVRTLLIMRDPKINIRKRCINSFFEWETLDRAVGGRREALGTKLHQATRKAISRCQPALLRAINKFNKYCKELEDLRPPGCTIPIPAPLSTHLNGLCNDPSLHEDVWIESSIGPAPRWLEDDDVRDGIRSLHIADWCSEELGQLAVERANLTSWMAKELIHRLPSLFKRDRLTCKNCRHPGLASFDSLWRPPPQQLLLFRSPLPPPSPQLPPSPPAASVAPTASAASVSSAASVAGPVAPTAAPALGPSTPATTLVRPVPTLVRATQTVVEEDDDMFEEREDPTALDCIVTSEEIDPGMVSDLDEWLLVEDVVGADTEDDDEESSGVEGSSVNFEIVWDPAVHWDLSTDGLRLLEDLQQHANTLVVYNNHWTRVVIGHEGQLTQEIEADDLARVASP
ncbi:hypothetical protein MVEN_00488700 [Mycena venus]|uniref:CxC1-like cysteine cluster associated with KDZ transposases domain-containing protein n=1 Tax=Mycena venus TaxID=2733690 RepID=A0A8H6YVS4_9AGAR|nr:hypothetical protein MVEN_00488700 [Mycena venus]